VKEILEPACRHLRLTKHRTSCRNVVSIEYMASTIIVVFLLQLRISTHKIMFFSKSLPQSQGYSSNIVNFFQISPLMFLFNQFSYKKSVGEELIYRGRDFNLLPFFLPGPSGFHSPLEQSELRI